MPPPPTPMTTATAPNPEWHRSSVDAVLEGLGSSPEGLSTAEAARRLDEYGPNEITQGAVKHPLRIVWEQISAVMVLILIAASILSLALSKFLEAGAIGGIVVLFVTLGFVQEYRAEQAIAALRRMTVPLVRVTRDGRPIEVASVDLVPGDVVLIEAGSVVPADLRLIEEANLRAQEAALTGESEPVDKDAGALDEPDLALGDRVCMAYSGTQVTYGRGSGVVVASGMTTELGRIASLLQEVEADQTPLQARLDRVGKQLAIAGLVVAGLVVAMGAVAGEPASELVLTAISVAVAVIPEGLPAVVTFTLAIGSQRMLRRNALIRKLPAVETLGSVTVICSDKTGTLTQNMMTVAVVDVAGRQLTEIDLELGEIPAAERWSSEEPAAAATLAVGLLCNDGSIEVDDDGEYTLVGDPTETALLRAAQHVGIDVGEARARLPRLGELPFDSERKRMTTLHPPIEGRVAALGAIEQNQPIALVKGAVDALLAMTVGVHDGERVVAFSEDFRDRITSANDSLASDGMRVLGVGYRVLGEAEVDFEENADLQAEDFEHDFVLIGLVGIIDPPRTEVGEAVRRCRTAGIRPVMITGDHPLTAQAIARELGITSAGNRGDAALTGAELERLSDAELAATVRDVSVFARVSPEHKLRIVESLQEQGQVTAMTGDGVNDAPALKRADIGVAMGITGTDVSKEASDMVLRDDNFATIVAAVEEGRVIYDNLRRFVSFAVAGNLGKIIVMLGWPLPYLFTGADLDEAIALLPLQLLWLNLMTDGLLGLSIGVEPAERGVMQRPPHQPGSSLWAGKLGRRTAWIGALIGVAALAVGYAYYETGRAEWQTMVFTSIAFMQVFQALGTRSNVDSLLTIGLFTNRVMIAISALVVALQLAALYTPLRSFLDLERLGPLDLALCIGLGVALLAALEVAKAQRRRVERGAAI